MQKEKKSSRILYLDILRIIAIFFVLYIHTGQRGKLHYQIAGMSASYYISMTLFCVAQICNMLFLMISGALLLNREENLKKTMKRFGRMVLVVILFSIFQFYCTYLQIPEMGFDVLLCLKIMYHSPIITQYWYLYIYLGFLLLLPLLRILAKHMEVKHYFYLFGLFILEDGILPIIERLWDNDSLNIDIPMSTMIIVFPLLGHFLAHKGEELWKNKRNLAILNVLAVISLIISVIEANIAYTVDGNTEYVLQGFIFFIVTAIFVDIKLFCEHFTLPVWIQRSITFAGNGVFGVYLLERQIKDNLVFIYDYLEPYTTWVVAVFVWLAASIMIGVVITNILKKIPGLKKLI